MSDTTRLKHEVPRHQVLIAGAISGLLSRFVVAPLDVIKIRLQLQSHSLSDPLSHRGVIGPTYKGAFGTLKHILRDEGVSALWKGNVPAEFLYLMYGAVQFLAYRQASALVSGLDLPSSATSFVSGASAGICATTATYPLDLLRTRFAAQGQDRIYPSILRSVHQIYTSEGVGGFYRGIGAGISQVVPYMGLFFAIYGSTQPYLVSSSLPLSSIGSPDAVAGVIASVCSKTVVFPLDTVRKRLQVQGPERMRYVHRNIPLYEGGVAKTLQNILKVEGVRGLYRGLTVGLLKAAPASAVTMWTYERVLAEFERCATL
ncbi:mitochondrial thiamine pyrophosphate carrier 1 [Eremomyces bilateralis CBS 781.70]|uniref:Mitochondrial thiamine pyrophosphate carrier 1 n=1 Tax=Eremomyces bilateralis CBS 781.70 TaxID=1392243 RepID=A0A6G1FQM1_9PEZI|nr:mitochondrial thiamine pyrophosphate carrier 1 [Eremomyces bilateralis CBS 781.70]KAF1808063.1 mitochondrial thiamine pyrophosphate carrier 1 [Eremomyces bilateralis CBS 781.70]